MIIVSLCSYFFEQTMFCPDQNVASDEALPCLSLIKLFIDKSVGSEHVLFSRTCMVRSEGVRIFGIITEPFCYTWFISRLFKGDNF